MIFSHYFPVSSAKVSKGVKPLSILIFVAFIILAFSYQCRALPVAYPHGGDHRVYSQCSRILTGYFSARSFGLSLADQKSITIEPGIQNSGLGLFLIFSFFNGLGGMAFDAAWWGIWHIISGLAIATYGRVRLLLLKLPDRAAVVVLLPSVLCQGWVTILF